MRRLLLFLATLLWLATTAAAISPVSGDLTFDRLGPFAIGMTLPEARAAAGGRLWRGDYPDDSCFYALHDDSAVALVIASGVVRAIEVAAPGRKTEAGLNVGDGLQRARELYPRHTEQWAATLDRKELLVLSRRKDRRLLIEIYDDAVSRIRVADRAIRLSRPCL